MIPRLVCLDLRVRPFSPMACPAETVVCLGNFDGVHLAHQAILREGVLSGRTRLDHGLCGVFCFFRPSADYKPGLTVRSGTHLTTLREKLTLCAMAGVDFACLCDFTEIRTFSPQAFTSLLIGRCGCRGVVCGFNYRFGANGAGRPEDLRTVFDRPDMAGAIVVPEMTQDGLTVSSTHIRASLSAGDVEKAASLLGRPYAVTGRVQPGRQLGRTLGFPTANLFFLPEVLIPAHGVYAARAHTPYGTFAAVANVGIRPTVQNGQDTRGRDRVNCETYILDFSHDLYGQVIRVELVHHLRSEQRFENLDALRQAICRDAETARRLV